MFGKFGKLLGKVDGILGLLGSLAKDIGDIKAFFTDGMRVWADIKAGQAELKGIMTPGPTPAAGQVVVAAPPAGHVLVPVPAEHVAALPDALASIIAGADPMKGVKLP